MAREKAMIRSGEFGNDAALRDYRAERVSDALIERAVWGDLEEPTLWLGTVIANQGYVWYRFWLSVYEQVVERYFTSAGEPVGTKIDVCLPPVCNEKSCQATDLLLDIWIDPDGRVTLHNEAEFEQAIEDGVFTTDTIQRAETHLRELTASIARGRFPPALVRNWQIDPERINAVNERRMTR